MKIYSRKAEKKSKIEASIAKETKFVKDCYLAQLSVWAELCSGTPDWVSLGGSSVELVQRRLRCKPNSVKKNDSH